jgi:hypothetical protein
VIYASHEHEERFLGITDSSGEMKPSMKNETRLQEQTGGGGNNATATVDDLSSQTIDGNSSNTVVQIQNKYSPPRNCGLGEAKDLIWYSALQSNHRSIHTL